MKQKGYSRVVLLYNAMLDREQRQLMNMNVVINHIPDAGSVASQTMVSVGFHMVSFQSNF